MRTLFYIAGGYDDDLPDFFNRYLLILFGAGLGGVARAAIATTVTSRVGTRFPFGTFLVNISGSFLIGFIMAVLTMRNAHPYWRLFLVVGFLGGYTTFSSFMYETLSSVTVGQRAIALANILASVIVGYCAVWLGSAIVIRR